MGDDKIKAQAVIEFTLALVILVVFIIATTRIFVWLAENIANRHMAYEATRSATSAAPPAVDFYNNTTGKKPLDIFKGENILHQ